MTKVRNAVIIIILCLIGAATYLKKPAELAIGLPSADQLKDAVAGRAKRVKNTYPMLSMRDGAEDTLRDAVAGHAAGTPAGLGAANNDGSTLGDIGAPPRGSGNGGFSPLADNPRGVTPPPVSPSGPQ